MFPADGLIDPPLTSDIEVGLRYRERKKEFFLGGSELGSVDKPQAYTGVRDTLWCMEYRRRVLYLSKDGVETVYLEDMGSISELSVCMDLYQHPVIVYLQSSVWFIRYFDPFDKVFITRELEDQEMVTPRICYDDKRLKAREDASVIVAYYLKNELRVLSSDNNYLSPRIIRREAQEENYLSQISMGNNGRLHFVTYVLVDE